MKGIVHIVVPREQFELLRGADAISTYEFGTGVAKHTFCRHCGIHSFYTPRSKPDGVSVNVRCLEGVDIGGLNPSLFDGQHWEEFMATHTPPGKRDRSSFQGHRVNTPGASAAADNPVIASGAKQSPSRYALRWRLPRMPRDLALGSLRSSQ